MLVWLGDDMISHIDRHHLLVGILIGVSWLSFYFFAYPWPEFHTSPYDNWWIARNTIWIAQDYTMIWTRLKDPWLRYAPQALVMAFLGVETVAQSFFTSVAINAHYTIFMEGAITPLVLYATTRLLWTKRAGVGALLVYALAVNPHSPFYPAITIPDPLISIAGVAAGCSVCRVELLGPTWYYSRHWQYAWVGPSMIAAIGFASRTARQRWGRYASLACGLAVGITISLQLIFGVFTAVIVGVTILSRRQWREFLPVGGAATSFRFR